MKRLLRSRKNRVIAGVCGGLGEYFDIDPVLIRLAWIVFSFFMGAGVFVYIIAWIAIPDAKSKKNLIEDWSGIKDKPTTKQSREMQLIAGFFILFLGVTFLLSNLGLFFWNWGFTWPFVLIAIGVIIIFSRRHE